MKKRTGSETANGNGLEPRTDVDERRLAGRGGDLLPQPVVYPPASATIGSPARPKSAKGANFQGLASLASLALLASLNPPKADANPIAIPPPPPPLHPTKTATTRTALWNKHLTPIRPMLYFEIWIGRRRKPRRCSVSAYGKLESRARRVQVPVAARAGISVVIVSEGGPRA